MSQIRFGAALPVSQNTRLSNLRGNCGFILEVATILLTLLDMSTRLRSLFPVLLIVLMASALAWAVSFGKLPPADFTFNNDDDVRTLDPSLATGQPEHRLLSGIFEGLLRQLPVPGEGPDANGVTPLEPAPGVAESYEVSEDGKTYTFKLRANAKWSNGDPVTAHDFAWTWRRTLHPETGAEYAYQLHYIQGAEAYTLAKCEPGDRVEVEYADRPDRNQLFPRGTINRGVLKEIRKPPKPELKEDAKKEEKSKAEAAWRKQWIYVIDSKPNTGDKIEWEMEGNLRSFATGDGVVGPSDIPPVEKCMNVLPDFETTVGIKVVDDRTLVVTLKNRTAYFNELVAFYPYYPVHRATVEKYGSPAWTKPGNLVGNGPFVLQDRRLRDRVRLVKNHKYWNADDVQFNVVDALSCKYQTTALNMYMNGQVDWIIKPPPSILAELRKRDDFVAAPGLITYFYRLNTARKPLDDARVRRALNMAIDKQAICEFVTRAGEIPATHLVPPGMRGYSSPEGPSHDVAEARRLLAEAGYPEGRDFPKLTIMFNTHDMHRDIAEVIQQQWKTNLGIEIDLRNLEWGVYLASMNKIDFDICRAGWIPDYPDPNTFLDMFVTDGSHNNTNWSSKKYDHLIEQAAAEGDAKKRMLILREAEQMLIDEQPIIPIYFYVTVNLVNRRVHNFSATAQDVHPLHIMRVDDLRSAPAKGTKP